MENNQYDFLDQIIGISVIHNIYGSGTIKDYSINGNEHFITVQFDNDKKEVKFAFPTVFINEIIKTKHRGLLDIIDEIQENDKRERVENSEDVLHGLYYYFESEDEKRKIEEVEKDGYNKIYEEIERLYKEANKFINDLKQKTNLRVANNLIGMSINNEENGNGEIFEIIKLDGVRFVKIKFKNGILRNYSYPEDFENHILVSDDAIKKIIENEIRINNNKKEINKLLKQYKEEKENEVLIKSVATNCTDDDLDKYNIFEVENEIVVSDTYNCNLRGHVLEDLTGIVAVVNKEGEVILKKISVAYCKNCDKYYMIKALYESIKKDGIPLCRITIDEYIKNKGQFNQYMNEESILAKNGYSVNQQDNLSKTQRQAIISIVIDTKQMSKSNIIGHLSYLINRTNYSRKNFDAAIAKWSDDIDFVSNYKEGTYKNIFINKIIERKGI